MIYFQSSETCQVLTPQKEHLFSKWMTRILKINSLQCDIYSITILSISMY